jgi:D-xylulose reductase
MPPSTFGPTAKTDDEPLILPEGVTSYLTSILSSSLSWLASDIDRETVIDHASHRLSQRSGRTGMGSLTRDFEIPTSSPRHDSRVTISLHEPALTEDNLGLKTWSSSYVLATKLHTLKNIPMPRATPVLELGAGTGLVGLAAAAVWHMTVIVTDLPSIVPNLARNVAANAHVLAEHSGRAVAGTLDWADPGSLELCGLPDDDSTFSMIARNEPCKATTILAADPIYSPDHPRLLVKAVTARLDTVSHARLVLAYPIRVPYLPQIQNLKQKLEMAGLEVLEEGGETTRDDWKEDVEVVWSVWRWRVPVL